MGNVAVDGFHSHHFAHIGFAGRITNHCRSATHQRNGLVPGTLHMSHGHNGNVVTDMQRVCGGVKTHVERGGLFQLLVEFLFKGGLRNESALLENIENVRHDRLSFYI